MDITDEAIEMMASRVAARLTELSTSNPSITFGKLFSLYMRDDVIPRGKREDNFRYFFNKHGKYWSDIACNVITTAALLKWRNETALACGKQGAQRAIDTMSAMFNWGIKTQILAFDRNPCKGIERFASRPRERFFSLEELEHLDRALSEESPLFQDFFIVCVLTGARRGNVQAMRWDEIDFDAAIWTITALKFKGRRTHSLPLSQPVISLLRERKQRQQLASEWVFPAAKSNCHLKDPRAAWDRVCARAGLEDARMHDLRRTLGSHLAIAGESAYIIGRMLGHKDHRSTDVYARLSLAPVRSAVDGVHSSWADYLSLPKVKVDTVSSSPSYEPIQRARSPKLAVSSGLTEQEKIIVEARILTALRAGANTRKALYRKFAGKFKLRSTDLTTALDRLMEAGLVEVFYDDQTKYCRRYRLKTEKNVRPELVPEIARVLRKKISNEAFEEKILECVDRGQNTKKHFWWKLPKTNRFTPKELSKLLRDMQEKGVVESYPVKPGGKCLAYRRTV